jgi:phosphatidylserine decarboxylase
MSTFRDDLSFILSNRIPRALATRGFAWFSRIENPALARLAIALWRRGSDLDLSEAKETTFKSLHACFIRTLKPGARAIDTDPNVLSSPCDAIVGACGAVSDGMVIQAKGFPYRIDHLLCDAALAARYRDGCYVTLRLTATMYHHFHAPCDGTVEHVTYIPGDTWNVNPIALNRVARLFCKNERAVIQTTRNNGDRITLVPVAAILVASIKLNFVAATLDMKYRGATEIPCRARFAKGDEMGYFQHGSTIIVFAPAGYTLCEGVRTGAVIRMGQALLRGV